MKTETENSAAMQGAESFFHHEKWIKVDQRPFPAVVRECLQILDARRFALVRENFKGSDDYWCKYELAHLVDRQMISSGPSIFQNTL